MKVPAYIDNRVREINKLATGMYWHFTPGLLNPADILSRGSDPQNIAENFLWKHGPDYLTDCDTYNLYLSEVEKPFPIYSDECDTCLAVVDEIPILPFFEKYSSLYKTIIVMAYVLRFINKCKKKITEIGKVSLK